jgi:uncharacterized protein (TIGR02687 family)
MSKISESLNKLFLQHRVIFWYDSNQELREEYNEVNLDQVKKVEVKRNPFEIKVSINQDPNQKYLLYFPYEKPSNESNWLLDMELAYHVFQTDQEALYLQELELDYDFKSLVSDHIHFFSAKERREKLKELLGKGDEFLDIRYKMLSVLFGVDQINIYSFLLAHLNALSNDNAKFDKDLDRYNLSEFYWYQVNSSFHFENGTPNILEFIIEIFNSTSSLGSKSKQTKEGRVLLSQWKDSITYKDAYRILSERISEALDIQSKLDSTSYELVLAEDHFELIDKKIISSLNDKIISQNIKLESVLTQVKQRENTFWYYDYKNYYDCLVHAAQLMELVPKYSGKEYSTIELGVGEYSKTLYKVDQLYRKFIWSYRETNQNRVLNQLYLKIEKVYSNDWLLTMNNQWQKTIDTIQGWPYKSSSSQQSFFKTHIQPFVNKNQKVFVVISDALRYECAEELTTMIQNENRYLAHIESMIGSLPSYTQLGMASILPRNDKMTLKEGSDIVLIDGIPASGIDGRGKILELNSGCRSTAIQSEKFMKMNSSTDGRAFAKSYDVIYIYSNLIDKVGDDKTSEDRVFEAVTEELENLIDLIKKIAAVNGNSILITSDHGFIYQHHDIDESDFSKSNYTGNVWKSNRRFVIGSSMETDETCKSFKGEDIGLQEGIDVLIPKSINRLRVQGSGSRFVHGGATLQEVTIPLIKISKKREDTTRQVEVDIIQTTNRITSNLLVVSFIQSEVVSEVVQPRTIKAELLAEDGTSLSDSFKYDFDFSEGSERQREVRKTFTLNAKASGQYKNQRVKLLLEEPVNGTSKWKRYKEFYFSLNISFTNDFDDF